MAKTNSWKVLVACVIVTGLTVSGCQTTGQSVGAGAAGGGLLGGIIGHQSGHAVEGALIGGAVGAIAGYAVHRYYENVRARNSSQTLATQEQTNAQWQTQNVGTPLPAQPQTELIREACVVTPGPQVAQGQNVGFKMGYRTVGQTASAANFCREDHLTYKEAGKDTYEPVKDFSALCTVPAKGTEEHTTEFTLPTNAPVGQYKLTSTLYDPQNTSQPRLSHDYPFNVVKKQASVSSETQLASAQ